MPATHILCGIAIFAKRINYSFTSDLLIESLRLASMGFAGGILSEYRYWYLRLRHLPVCNFSMGHARSAGGVSRCCPLMAV
jgi:hypothetical protein